VVLRIQISAGLDPDDAAINQPFVFACPLCRAGQHGVLHGGEGMPHLSGEDFDLIDGDVTGADPVVSVATDVPVHASLSGGRADEPLLTPYMKAVSMVGPESASDVVESVAHLRNMRENALPFLRRGLERYAAGDPVGALAAASGVFRGAQLSKKQVEPGAFLRAFLQDVYRPLGGAQVIDAAARESAEVRAEAHARDGAAAGALEAALVAGALPEHRRRVLDAAVAFCRTSTQCRQLSGPSCSSPGCRSKTCARSGSCATTSM
jgi:hypothetical protein